MEAPASGDTKDTLIRKIGENMKGAFGVGSSIEPNEDGDTRMVLYRKWLEIISEIP